MSARIDPEAFIKEHTRLKAVPGIPEISIYTAHSKSGLGRIAGQSSHGGGPAAPYWAYPWAGGIALARHILLHPELVEGRRVLDLGAGSGLVAIAAALAGAKNAAAADVDRFAQAAIRLNSAANGVAIEVISGDITNGDVPATDIILAGDVFYDAEPGTKMRAFFERCVGAGIPVLVGDPGRRDLPVGQLRLLAEYKIADFGAHADGSEASFVYAYELPA